MTEITPTTSETTAAKERADAIRSGIDAIAEQNLTSDQVRCYLQKYREEIIKNGLESLPAEIRDAVIAELFGPEKTDKE